jgi:hypothetical protein
MELRSEDLSVAKGQEILRARMRQNQCSSSRIQDQVPMQSLVFGSNHSDYFDVAGLRLRVQFADWKRQLTMSAY